MRRNDEGCASKVIEESFLRKITESISSLGTFGKCRGMQEKFVLLGMSTVGQRVGDFSMKCGRGLSGVAPRKTLCGSLVFNSGAVILGSLASICLLPSHAAMGQSPTFHGVQVSQRFDPNSDLADSIRRLTTKPSGLSKVRLGQWVVVPGSKDNYYTYEMQELTLRTTSKVYLIFLLADTTSNNPKRFGFAVDCSENKLRPTSYQAFSSRGDTVTKPSLDEPWTAPSNNFWQGLVNAVCRLGS